MEIENPAQLIERLEKEVIPSMLQKMNSVIESADRLKNVTIDNKRVANSTNQN
jgi:hypothetical protein